MPPLRPFPFPSMSIGTDIVSITRIKNLILPPPTKTQPHAISNLPNFLRHTLTPREIALFKARFEKGLSSINERPTKGLDPSDDTSNVLSPAKTAAWWTIARHLAGRWAAKEAVVKACYWRKLTLLQVEILKDERNRVYGVILDQRREVKMDVEEAQEIMAGRHEDEAVLANAEEAGQVVRVSISHEEEYATAVCVAASEEGREGDVGGEAAAREPI